MKLAKTIFALALGVGIPALLAGLFFEAAQGFANQHVDDKSIVGNTVVHHVFTHSQNGIVAASIALGLGWLVLTVGFVALGNAAWEKRGKNWGW